MPDVARNFLFDQAVKFGYDYILFLDDDMVVDASLLVDLTKILDADPSVAAVAPLAFRRHPPFYPCLMIKSGDKYEHLLDLDGPPVDVDVIHFAATLVRVDTLAKVAPPRFEFSRNGDALEGEDLVLSEKLRSIGGRLVCHRAIPEALHIGLPQLIGRKSFKMARQDGA
jgi:GT2 family glycosyltransferase